MVKVPKVIILRGNAKMPKIGLRTTERIDKTVPLSSNAGNPPKIFTPLNNCESKNRESELKRIDRIADFMGFYASK